MPRHLRMRMTMVKFFGVDDDEGGIGRYLMGEKKKGQHPSQLQQGNRKKNMKIN